MTWDNTLFLFGEGDKLAAVQFFKKVVGPNELESYLEMAGDLMERLKNKYAEYKLEIEDNDDDIAMMFQDQYT